MSFVKIGPVSEFEDLEAGKLVEVSGQSVAVFNIAGRYYAIENTCPHRGGPLADGMMAGEEVICPWHGARFNVKTGAVMGPPAQVGVKSFPVRVNGSDLEVELDGGVSLLATNRRAKLTGSELESPARKDGW